jgi:hypothetical protein
MTLPRFFVAGDERTHGIIASVARVPRTLGPAPSDSYPCRSEYLAAKRTHFFNLLISKDLKWIFILNAHPTPGGR